ncbi:MAG: GIY-YIG nuclease family protein [Candidatus Poribacteria bacterium]|nr:GIY-YIG nuclease family protein [Candidatus Poribacteria bacterium]
MKNPGIYILTSPSGKKYVGKDSNLPSRVRDHLSGNSPKCPAIHKAIQKYGRDAFSVEIIRYPGISEDALNAVECWWIRRLQTLSPSGYNLTDGGDGGSPSEETRKKLCKKASKRVEDGTHPFLDGEIQRRAKTKRDAVNKKRLEGGTHNFLDGEIQRRTHKKRLENGTHHFLGENNPSHKRVKDGTHNFLDGEIQRRNTRKQIEDGTHNFFGENHPIKQLSKEGRHPSTRKRLKAEWCYIIALSRFYYEIHDYTLKRRAEFLSKDIPDMSNAEQEYLF